MVQYYSIAGRQIGSHYLAMLTLAAIGTGATLSMGGSKAQKAQSPPINASSSDEANFIEDFLKNADAGAKKGADGQKKEDAAH